MSLAKMTQNRNSCCQVKSKRQYSGTLCGRDGIGWLYVAWVYKWNSRLQFEKVQVHKPPTKQAHDTHAACTLLMPRGLFVA